MSTLIAEKVFEEHIEKYLNEQYNYIKRTSSSFDKRFAIDGELLAQFLAKTQEEEWSKYLAYYGELAIKTLGKRIQEVVDRFGLIHILRKGISDGPASFQLFYPREENDLNQQTALNFKNNIFSVMRQCRYSERNDNSIDIVIFVNGIPLITIEVKTQFTGQNVADAIIQYKSDRNPNEPLLKFKRTLVHFAVDTEQVYFCTKLDGHSSWFLPFNQGYE